MSDVLDAMFEAPTPEPAPVVETVAPEVQPAPEAPAPEPAAEPTPARPEPGFVPIAAVMDERLKRRDLEKEVAQLRTQQTPPKAADPYDDPAGFQSEQQQFVDERINTVRFQMSDAMARQVHGADTVDQAVGWANEKAQADPIFAASFMRDANPIDWIVRQHKRDGLLSEIGDVNSVDDWFTREAAKRGYQPTPAPAAVAPATAAAMTQPAPKPAAPPRSIASDAPASSETSDPAADFMAIFRK